MVRIYLFSDYYTGEVILAGFVASRGSQEFKSPDRRLSAVSVDKVKSYLMLIVKL